MTPDQKETIENIRRTAERGLSMAVESDHRLIDLFQHILDHVCQLDADCPKCGGDGVEHIHRAGGIHEYWPCDCPAGSKK